MVTNLQMVAEMLNAYFVETVGEITTLQTLE